jgi:hypothetical protein
MVELRIVVPVVAGSNPVGHPKYKMAETRFWKARAKAHI